MITPPRRESSPSKALPPGFLGTVEPSAPTFVTPTPSRAGEVLDRRYELVQQVGKGGMGVVYVARDRQLPRPVAVKILRSREPVLEQRFLDEIEILATISHPSLVQPLGHSRTAAGELFLVMEYIRGDNLSQRLAELGPLGWREGIAVGIAVGQVLAVLHAAGVLHRDIKPSNIMVCGGGDQIMIKVIDLGVAKKQPDRWADAEAAGRFHTDAGVAVGTPHYQPPEAGLVPADPRFDVFGLAATIYELCAGKGPARGPYRPLGGDAPPTLDDVLTAALALDPDARTASIEELVAGLQRVRDTCGPAPLFDDRYEILHPLGSGGKCEVLLAHHRKISRDVALKILERDTDEERARLRREARVLGLLQHPAFPTLHDFHEHEGRPYLVMEVVRGQRASRFVESPLSPAHVVEVGIQLAEALLALGDLGVVHRDIYASNVLIDFECAPRSRPVVRLLDLGMCELLPAFYARVHRYGTPPENRVVLGTGGSEQFDWTAPEGRRERKWAEKSDVWSVALLLFQLLTGRRPFPPNSDDPPESPRRWVPECSSELAGVLLAALNPDPQHRPTPAQLLAQLIDVRDAQALEDGEVDGGEVIPIAPKARSVLAVVPSPGAAHSAPLGPEPEIAASVASVSALGRGLDNAASPRARLAALAGIIAAAALVAGLIAHVALSERSPPHVPEEVAGELAPAAPLAPPDATTVVRAAGDGQEDAPAAPPTLDLALAAAETTLRRCARQAGGEVLVELRADAGVTAFTSIVVMSDDLEIDRCVRDVLTPLRFAPSASPTTRVTGFRP